eukprot:UC4_evm5s1092
MAQKARTYDIGGSNIAGLGTPLEKAVKKAASESENAWGALCQPDHPEDVECGLKIWRIEKFNVVPWPEKDYGSFYSGDSYIILHTYYKKKTVTVNGREEEQDGKKMWDVHFFIGRHSSQDEYGTAAYKAVELDDYLFGYATIYREVQEGTVQPTLTGDEPSEYTPQFLALGDKFFGGKLEIWEGGIDSGFRHVEPEVAKPRLLHIKGQMNVMVKEVKRTWKSLNSGDSFVLDMGLLIFVWHGSGASPMEKAKSMTLTRALDDERGGKAEIVTVEDGEEHLEPEFWEAMGDQPGRGETIKTKEEAESEKPTSIDSEERVLLRLTDDAETIAMSSTSKYSINNGKPQLVEVARGKTLNRNMLDSRDVFILDMGWQVVAWVGLEASIQERKQALNYCGKYLADEGKPADTSIVKVLEGGENETFEQAFEVGVMSTKGAAARGGKRFGNIRGLSKTKSAARSVIPGGSYTKGPGAAVDIDELYRQQPVDPTAWKGRGKKQSSYSLELQKAKYGAYNPSSGWRVHALQDRFEKMEDPSFNSFQKSKASLRSREKRDLAANNNEIVKALKDAARASGAPFDEWEIRDNLDKSKEIFSKYDSDHSGEIDIYELMKCFQALGKPRTKLEIKRMFKWVDTNTDNKLSYPEFANLMLIDDGFMDPQESYALNINSIAKMTDFFFHQ